MTLVGAMSFIYLNVIRRLLSPALWYTIRYTRYLFARPPKVWRTFKNYDKTNFLNEIKKLPYRADPLYGAIDYTVYDLDFFFWHALSKGRDCDDFAYAWYSWAKNKRYPAKMLVVMEGNDITTSHVITIFRDSQGWNCANLRSVGSGYRTANDALKYLMNFEFKNPNGKTFRYNNIRVSTFMA